MKNLKMILLISVLIFIAVSLFIVSSKMHKYNDCPRDKETLLREYHDSYSELLSIMKIGEGGKLETLQKQEADKKYKFHAECLKRFGNIVVDKVPTKKPKDDENDK